MHRWKKQKRSKPGWIFLGLFMLLVVTVGKSHGGLLVNLQSAQRHVDHAWEVYHTAALSGTLASPEIQMNIEKDLHLVRTILVEARDAKSKNQKQVLQQKLKEIESITVRVIRQSQEKKQ